MGQTLGLHSIGGLVGRSGYRSIEQRVLDAGAIVSDPAALPRLV